jgi:pyridoxamine 5'-phosphate oxidase
LASRQSEVLEDPADLDRALTVAEDLVQADPDMVGEKHTVYAVTPTSVEFWQGDAQRRHVRLRYRRTGHSWVKELLWP